MVYQVCDFCPHVSTVGTAQVPTLYHWHQVIEEAGVGVRAARCYVREPCVGQLLAAPNQEVTTVPQSWPYRVALPVPAECLRPRSWLRSRGLPI